MHSWTGRRPCRGGKAAFLLTVLLVAANGRAHAQEVGANDFQISGDFLLGTTFDSVFPAVAYNPLDDNYLVVWQENYRHLGCAEGVETSEIHKRLVDGASGSPVGSFQTAVSSMGDSCDSFAAREAAVVFNSVDSEYFVVWSGSDDADGGLTDEFEIFGQRLTGANGFLTGMQSRRLTALGGIGAASPDARRPALAHNPTHNEYLLVYENGQSIEARILDPTGTTLHGPTSIGLTLLAAVSILQSRTHRSTTTTWWSGPSSRMRDQEAPSPPCTSTRTERRPRRSIP